MSRLKSSSLSLPNNRDHDIKNKSRRLSWIDLPNDEDEEDNQLIDDKANDTNVKRRHLSKDSLVLSTGLDNSSLDTRSNHSSKNRVSIISSISNPLARLKADSNIGNNTILEEKKSRAIWCLRTLTLITLTTAAVVVAVLTFTYSKKSELRVFETQYQDSVIMVSEAISLDIRNKLNTAMSFSAIYTSRFGLENSWPNVTLPNFQQQAKGQLDIADGIALSFNPIITNKTRTGWEAYAAESSYILGEDNLEKRSCDTCRIVQDGIFRKENNIAVNDTGVSAGSRNPYHMVPVWQIYPMEQNWKAVMFNLHSEIIRQHALDDMLEYKVPTVTGLLKLVQHTEMDPSSILFYPVFNRFDESGFFKKVEGSISIVFTWADILRSVLPAYIKGLIVVLESSIADELDKQQFTYSISGEEVNLLGEGDMHDADFDKFKHEVFANLALDTGHLGIVDYLITYKLRIYPSKEFKNEYLTSRPLSMTLVVTFMFMFTSGVFLFYDYLVHNRQDATMKFAARSGRIVDSLFPSGVRERLFSSTEHLARQTLVDTNVGKDDGIDPNPIPKRNTALKIKKFLKGRGSFQQSHSDSAKGDVQTYIQSTPPIADLFHNTTIMFADMVSFTEWSSKHSPEDVFYLLETLFLEFDKVAERMNVFKLGTIGDCYIAVTGIPDAREDHAVAMAKFADECRTKTNLVLAKLSDEFDQSVGDLAMRIGLHSGSVTAGVLRGLKSRFELFGDAMNTASRMESTGVRDKIQVSEDTAALINEKGFESWLQPREELIHAKGKGYLQTYWLEIHENESTHVQMSSDVRSQHSFVHQMYSDTEHVDIHECDLRSINNQNESSRLFPGNENAKRSFEIKDGSILSQCSSSSSIFVEDSTIQEP